MPFKVSIHDDLSIKDLIDIKDKGGVVLKTPHVGNIYPNNLAIASLGIPMLFYDRTLGVKDISFHPDKIIIGGRSTLIADPNILTTHSIVKKLPGLAFKDAAVGMKLVDFHMSSFKRALPQADCFTYTEYIQNNKSQILQILEKITEFHPYLWSRGVDESGKTFKSQAKNWDDIIRSGVLGLTSMKSGWIIPNPVSILFHGTVDTLKANAEDVYLLSGPDMYRYIEGYQLELNEAYDYLRKSLKCELPEMVRCHIIPVICMRFIVEVDYRKVLDNLVDAYLRYVSVDDAIRKILKSGAQNMSIDGHINKKDKIKEEIYSCIKGQFDAFKTTMFYDVEEAGSFSQYDLANSKGLYVHPWAVNSKLSDVSKAYSFLLRCYLLVRDRLQEEM
ncbi:MAG: hypothetical protein Q8L64_03720 [bacterium]|nr:hypothetical protein [bacterium]